MHQTPLEANSTSLIREIEFEFAMKPNQADFLLDVLYVVRSHPFELTASRWEALEVEAITSATASASAKSILPGCKSATSEFAGFSHSAAVGKQRIEQFSFDVKANRG